MEQLIHIHYLRYDWDVEIGRGDKYPQFDEALEELEQSLPTIPEHLVWFKEKYYPELVNIYHSIKKEGMHKPLEVMEVNGLYRVRVGNQRLCCLRALAHTFVKCIPWEGK